ncbi:MAG: hypothetical protein U0746_21600 [Gemmataceae bacterium]
MSKTTKVEDNTLTPATEAELLKTEGGVLADDWCGTRVPGWPRPHWGSIATLGGIVVNPAVGQMATLVR